MTHFASPRFWQHYRALPPEIQRRADEAFKLLKTNPRHPSLQLQKKGRGWSVRVTPGCRALAKERAEGLVWFGIGPHDEYERMLRSL